MFIDERSWDMCRAKVITHVGLMKSINVLTELAPDDEAVVGHRDRENVATGATILSETPEIVGNIQRLLN
jgi:hypothetical protein